MNNDSLPKSPNHTQQSNNPSATNSSSTPSSKSISPRSRRGKISIPSSTSSSSAATTNTLTMSKDNVIMSKLKGLKWKSFSEIAAKTFSLYSDDEDIPISELSDKSHKSSKIISSHSSSSSKKASKHRGSKGKGSVMRLDKADMGLYGLCPETDPFFAVICDICGSVVKPQGLRKHISTRHHSHYNFSSTTTSSSTHYSSTRDPSSTFSVEHVRVPNSNDSNHSKSEKLVSYSSSSSLPVLDDGSSSQSKNKSSSSNSSKVKSKNGKSSSSSSSHVSVHVGSKSSNSGASSSSKSSNSSIYSSSSSSLDSVPLPTESSTLTNSVPTASTSLDKKSSFSSTSSGISSDSTSSSNTSSPSGKSSSKRSSSKSSSNSNGSKSDSKKVLPVKDREYDPEKHCGVLSDSKKQCLRSLTCKSHSLSSRRAVQGRSKTFDRLLSDHRLSKESATEPAGTGNVIEVESSSNSSSSFDVDVRRSTNGALNDQHESPISRPPSEIEVPETPEKAPSSPVIVTEAGNKNSTSSSPTVSHSHKSEHHRSKHKNKTKAESQVHLNKTLQKLVQQKVHEKHQLREAAERERQTNYTADMLAQHFTQEIPNTILTEASIVMDPNTNLVKLSVSGTLRPTSEAEAPQESIQQFATTLIQEPLTVTVPLSVISSMNISGMNAPEEPTTNISNEVVTSHMNGGIPTVLIRQENNLQEIAQYTTQDETFANLQIPSYDESINYIAQNLPAEQSLQVDLSENIDDIVPTLNLLPINAPMQSELLDQTIILAQNDAIMQQQFIEETGIKQEVEILTVNMNKMDFSKLLLLTNVDDDFIKQRNQQNEIFNSQIDEFRGVKMWYNTLPKPLHINNYQMKKVGGGIVLRKKLLNVRKTMINESQNISKSLSAQISPLPGSRSSLNLNNRSDSANIIIANNKLKDTNGGISLQNSQNSRFANRGQRRLIVNSNKKTGLSSIVMSNSYFKNLLTSQSSQSSSNSSSCETLNNNSSTINNNSNCNNTSNNNQLKRPSSTSLTSLSNKRLKLINNFQNSTAPPQILLQSSPKHKPKYFY